MDAGCSIMYTSSSWVPIGSNRFPVQWAKPGSPGLYLSNKGAAGRKREKKMMTPAALKHTLCCNKVSNVVIRPVLLWAAAVIRQIYTAVIRRILPPPPKHTQWPAASSFSGFRKALAFGSVKLCFLSYPPPPPPSKRRLCGECAGALGGM